MKPDHKVGLQFMNLDVGRSYFFTHVLVVLSHFMSVNFLHSAFVFGAAAASTFGAGGVAGASFVAGGVGAAVSAANAGALTASRRPATIAVLIILADILKCSPWFSRAAAHDVRAWASFLAARWPVDVRHHTFL